MKLYLHFGAGGIGRALAGPIFSRAGYNVLFVDAAPQLVELLHERRAYTVRVKDTLPPGTPDSEVIRNVDALALTDMEAITKAVTEADVIGTAVGQAHVPAVLKTMLPGLLKRTSPVSILFCENIHDARSFALETLSPLLPKNFPLDERIGLVPTCIGKMVPRAITDDPLEVWGEAYDKIIADPTAFRGEIPRVKGLILPPCFLAFVDRKLYIHNLGHATCAVHGFLRGHATICEAIGDEAVERETRAVMRASALALAKRWPNALEKEDLLQHVEGLLHRFHNPFLRDTVFRVGRDLSRKLKPDDRFIGALRLVREQHGDTNPVIRAIAAALNFHAIDENGNPFAGDVAFFEEIKTRGLDEVLRAHCQIEDPAIRVAICENAALRSQKCK